ncbi:GntR family transcriptional regulator [Aquibacillus sediminis]|uniref:GntR family transcriptional regulator n=1 Tax=Aquibacillus sediminis TaxID=2574734 RepID=UPI001486B4AE|nr:GntR family transcriptional regulator [Aquibacillus sediminis]
MRPSLSSQRLSTKDLVYFEIKQKIIEGLLKPNQSINEESLASELDISRTPIREALQRLEMQELVIRLPNGRLKVAPISIQEVEELFNVRSLLEGLVTREATIQATDKDMEKLKQYTQLIVDASEADQRVDVVNFGSEFHNYLYQISRNQTATKILNQLNDRVSRYRRLAPTKDNKRSQQAAEEHKKLFEAIANRNHDQAEKLMREHIHNSLNAAKSSIALHLHNNE